MGTSKYDQKRHILWKARKRIWCGLPWTFTVYSLSEDRFFIKRGIFNTEEDEVRLYRIKDISLRRSLGQRIFGLGTIDVCSSDANMRDFQIINIRNSRDVKEMLSELVEDERQRKRVYARELVGHEEHDELDAMDYEALDDYDENDLP